MHVIQRRFAVAATAALLSTGLALTVSTATASAAAQTHSHASVQVSQIATPGNAGKGSPDAEPTGCPQYELCTYIGTGAQGGDDICFYRSGGIDNFGALYSEGGDNCHSNDGALVNTHTTGENTLWSGTNASGHETCIADESYYQNLNNNFYPGTGTSLDNNIDSSYHDAGTTCEP
jgi:hypothetical protein